MRACVCVCVFRNKFRREGATGFVCVRINLEERGRPGWASQLRNWSSGRLLLAGLGPLFSQSALRGPGREFEIRNPSPATVLGAEGEARPKGKEQRMYAEGARVGVWSGLSSF